MSPTPRRSPTRFSAFLVIAAMASPGFLACGSDEGTRGLQPGHETATPASDADDAMTEAERRKRQAEDTQRAEIEEFDRAEGDSR